MKKGILKAFLWGFLIFTLINVVKAETTVIGPDFDRYNLGDSFDAVASILSSSDMNGFFSASLNCGSYNLIYYTIPINIKAGATKQINIDALPIIKNMVGECFVETILEDQNKQFIEKGRSKVFTITDKLEIDSRLDKLVLKPGDNLIVSGEIRNARNEVINEGLVTIKLEKDYATEIKKNEFGYELILSDVIKTGEHTININAVDNLGNNALTTLSFTVEAIPTTLKNSVNKVNFLPEEKLILGAVLFDQANDELKTDVNLVMYDSDGNEVFSRAIITGENIEYQFPKYAKPGKWIIKTESSGLSINSELTVDNLEELYIDIDGDVIVLTNIGNILYTKPVKLEISGKEIVKETAIEPGESVVIDLSKESINAGSYDVNVASGDNSEGFSGVNIDKKRKNFGEILASTLPLTGYAVLGSGDNLPFNMLYVYLVLFIIVVILLIVFTYKKKSFIKRNAYRSKWKIGRWFNKIIGEEKPKREEKTLGEVQKKLVQQKKLEELKENVKGKVVVLGEKKEIKKPYTTDKAKQDVIQSWKDRAAKDGIRERNDSYISGKRAAVKKYMDENPDLNKGYINIKPKEKVEEKKEYDIVIDDAKNEIKYKKKEPTFTSNYVEEDATVKKEEEKKDEEEKGMFSMFD